MSDATSTAAIETPLLALHRASGATISTWFGCALPELFSQQRGSPNWLAEYHAYRQSVALIDKNYRAYLRFTGPDRVRYLNAILTSNIRDLVPGHGAIGLFLNPQGRIQAELETYADSESLFCVSYAMIRPTLVPALDKFIIMDDVTLIDETPNWGTVALEGPLAIELTKKLTGVDLNATQELQLTDATTGGIACVLGRRSPGGIPGAEFRARREDLAKLWEILRRGVQEAGGKPVGYRALSAIRLEQDIPWFGYDFSDKQIPHEAGLQDSHISYTKGCYTGQEIVERVRSRGQVNRLRVLLKIASAEPPASGTPLLADGKEVGHTTRSAFSPLLQTAIALAYLRRESSAPGTPLLCASASATVIAPPVDFSPYPPGPIHS